MLTGTTVNVQLYCETLKKLRRAIQNRRRVLLTKRACSLQENASSHVARVTTELFSKFGWDFLTRFVYSADLTHEKTYGR